MVTEDRCQSEDMLELRSRKVCRALWGPVDHEQLKRDMDRELKAQQKHLSQKYNFDFENERPLKGRWSWKKSGGSDGPSPNSTTTTEAKAKRRKVHADASHSSLTNFSNDENSPVEASILKKVVRRKSTRRAGRPRAAKSK